jgi:anaerobic magnesium-protoporphyrin IX monomethyl ester cyclase
LYQPLAYIPLGLAYIAAVLEENGFSVVVDNLADSKEDQFKISDAHLYGITCTTSTYHPVTEISQLLKRMGKRVVVGGIHPSIFPEETLHECQCDHVVIGDGEYSFLDVVTGDQTDPFIIREPTHDLDAIPFPARHLFDNVVDTTGIHGQPNNERATTMITSRGCPYNCSFCCKTPETMTPRSRSPENIIEEIWQIENDYDIEHIRFVDDVFTLSKKRTMKLCDFIRNESDVTWICITRADLIDEELLKVMKSSGCLEVHLGIESGSQRILDAMNKKTTVETNFKAIQKVKDAGMLSKIYLMHGYPGETEKDIDATKQFVIDAKPDKFTISQFTFTPGSAIWRTPPSWFYPDDERHTTLKNELEEALQ